METQTTKSRRRGLKALMWLGVASLVAVYVFGTASVGALAVVGTSLHQTPPISSDDAEFQEDCDPGSGNVLWHFVLVQTAASSGTLTATFDTAGVVVVGSTKKTGGTLHFDVVTAGADTLLGASTDAVGKLLNLSHICSGDTTTTTTSTSTSTSTSSTTTN